jgi:hypothetical protein
VQAHLAHVPALFYIDVGDVPPEAPAKLIMATDQITFDKLVYVDRLKAAGIDEGQARAHADALDHALRDSVATSQDLRDVAHELRQEITRLDHKIEVAVRDLTIRMGGIAILLFGALASIKFFG